MKLQKIIFVMLLLLVVPVVGAVSSAPTTINDRSEYSQSLNSIASVIMNWYGSLIIDDNKTTFDGISIDDQWLTYRSQYPNNITQIVITSTKLLKLGNDYQFNVKSKISYQENNKSYTSSLNEVFVFSDAYMYLPKIKTVTLIRNKNTEVFETKKYNREHYKVREFTYAWLSYLDNLSTLNSVMYADKWIESANYSLDMGNVKIEGSIADILLKRKEVLTTGGHLLRSLDVKKVESSIEGKVEGSVKGTDTFIIDIILEWKGKNPDGKSVIARIHQELKIHIKKDKTWEVISIKEKHLLPIIAPWVGLLC